MNGRFRLGCINEQGKERDGFTFTWQWAQWGTAVEEGPNLFLSYVIIIIIIITISYF